MKLYVSNSDHRSNEKMTKKKLVFFLNSARAHISRVLLILSTKILNMTKRKYVSSEPQNLDPKNLYSFRKNSFVFCWINF